MTPWNPFSLEQWIAWLVATGIAGITGTVGILSYAEKHYASKNETELTQRFNAESMGMIRSQLEKIEIKMDRLLEKEKR